LNRDLCQLSRRAIFASALAFVLVIGGCSKHEQENEPAPPAEAAAPESAPGEATPAASNAPAAAAPAGSPDAHEQQLLAQAQSATTANERRKIYTELVRLHPENKSYRHELRKAKRQARADRKASHAGKQG
jgi:hypothetical protein